MSKSEVYELMLYRLVIVREYVEGEVLEEEFESYTKVRRNLEEVMSTLDDLINEESLYE